MPADSLDLEIASQPEPLVTSSSRRIRAALGSKSIVLVGMMGCGKTSAGKRLAASLGLPFADADVEIENAANLSIAEIFATYGEAYFRDGERRVMARLLAQGPQVIATGGGAFMNEQTRARTKESGLSVWLDADLDLLMTRVKKRPTRPLLQTPDPEGTMRKLMEERNPVYATANIAIKARDAHHDVVVKHIIEGIEAHFYPASRCLRVELAERSYDIFVEGGLIEQAGDHIARLAPKAACAILTDENVAPLYLERLQKSLDEAQIRHTAIIIPAGEASKSFAQYQNVCNQALAARIERGDFIIALGGGVIGDLAGFVAATLRRGARFIQIPTTLLSQVDSSVGGKTGINSPYGKNLIGAFHQPALVLADANSLDTLPLREFRAGYAEVVKYGIINDDSFFTWLERNGKEIFSGGPARIEAIAKSCSAKAAIVARDETEQGDRALLNFGHTFGHAFERLTNYDSARLVHGEAVAIGMVYAMAFSAQLGFCGQDAVERVAMHLKQASLPIAASAIPHWNASPDAMLDAMLQDKKVQQGLLTFILAHGVGKAFIAKDIPALKVREFLNQMLSAGF